jgi:hypothetical protein
VALIVTAAIIAVTTLAGAPLVTSSH